MQKITDRWPRALKDTLNLVQSTLNPHRITVEVASPAHEIMRWVLRHRLEGWLGGAMPKTQRDRLKPELWSKLKEAHVQNALRAIALTGELTQIGNLLNSNGVPWLTVKGPVLAQQVWGGVTHRHSGDLDIVVSPEHARQVDQLLRDNGYERTMPDFELTSRQFDSYLNIKYEFGYRSRKHQGRRVEIKWRLDDVDRLDELLQHPAHVPIAGRQIPTLPPADNFRYLCHHGARHGWFRIFWLLDIARLLKNSDLKSVSDSLPDDQAHRTKPVIQAMELCALLFAPPPDFPEPPRNRLSVSPLFLQKEALRQMALSNKELDTVGEWWRQLRYRLHLFPGFRGMTDALRPHLQSPLNWKTLPLPDRWHGLYPWLSPVLWCLRLWQRRGGRRKNPSIEGH